MTSRIIIQPGRIVVSKPGFTVSTGMPDSQKIFDSDWNWSGILLEAGVANDPGGGDWNLMFKKNYGYAPTVIARQLASFSDASAGVPWSGPDVLSPGGAPNGGPSSIPSVYIYPDRIFFPRNFNQGGAMNYGTIEYEVYGVD